MLSTTGSSASLQVFFVLINQHTSLGSLLQAAFDQLTLDNTDQRADFASHMAQAEHDAADQKAAFDCQMAKADLEAGGMKVGLAVVFYAALFPDALSGTGLLLLH